MVHEKKFILGDLVKGLRTFNGEIVEGKFNGFHLHDKLDPTSVIGVICVEGDRCYDVVAGSIELLENEDERIRKALVKQFSDYSVEETFYCVKNKDILAWLEKQGEKSNYNPYKATIESISAMVEKYAPFDSNLQDFYDNIKVKCKDAMEYDNTWLEKQSEQKTAWNGEDEAGFGNALWAIEQARSIAKDENDMGNLWYAERWLKSIKERMKGE